MRRTQGQPGRHCDHITTHHSLSTRAPSTVDTGGGGARESWKMSTYFKGWPLCVLTPPSHWGRNQISKKSECHTKKCLGTKGVEHFEFSLVESRFTQNTNTHTHNSLTHTRAHTIFPNTLASHWTRRWKLTQLYNRTLLLCVCFTLEGYALHKGRRSVLQPAQKTQHMKISPMLRCPWTRDVTRSHGKSRGKVM